MYLCVVLQIVTSFGQFLLLVLLVAIFQGSFILFLDLIALNAAVTDAMTTTIHVSDADHPYC